jgi:hypothetical protein
MAGSLRWYIYRANDGTEYGVLLDEDTGNAPALGFDPVLTESNLDTLPKGFVMRYVNAVQVSGSAAGFRYRSFACGSDDADLFTGDVKTFTINGLDYEVTSTRGERSRRPRSTNSGLIGSSPTVGVSTGA